MLNYLQNNLTKGVKKSYLCNMKSRKGFSSLSVQVTATVSVTLVLLLLGMVASMALAARTITNGIKENMGFDVELREETPADSVQQFRQQIAGAPFVSSVRYYSPEESLEQWRQEMGEDLTQLLDVNPFLPQFEINVKAQYATADSLRSIIEELKRMPAVYKITSHTEVVNQVNRNMNTLMIVLFVAALALLPISFVLINNTVRLTIYARRFLIHTMKLVGASRGFIRRPFILSNMLQGLVAAILASAFLAAMYWYVWSLDGSLRSILTPEMLAWVCGGMVLAGQLLCLTAAFAATQRYLTRRYDELF